ncbi:MAG TPA: sigma-70 family RNA polymerase sigma factor [Polyangiaceae bacterium]|nr:sigma-70 family RNA polymerase sigma factor [Polyangiaceae bacterium]
MQRKSVASFTPRVHSSGKGASASAYAHGEVGDELLMVRYQRGDRDAFASLVRRHKRGVFNFLARLIGDRAMGDSAAADELAVQVFLRVVRRSSEFKQEARFRTWLYGIARGVGFEHLRRIAPRKPAEDASVLPVELESLPQLPPERPEPSGSAPERSILDRSILAAVESMSLEQREVYLLRELGELSFKEIADVTGAPESVVKQRTRQALERIQQVLGDFEEYQRELK